MSKEELRRYIEEEWCKIDDDKALCRRFMKSIPKRLQVNHEFTVLILSVGVWLEDNKHFFTPTEKIETV